VTGTPADCVHLAFAGALSTELHATLGGEPNLVLSGINHGENLGDDILYSGTVGAARVAALFGCPAVAVSAPAGMRSEQMSEGLTQVIQLIEQGLLSQGRLWNINLPATPLQGVRLTSLGRRWPSAPAESAIAPRGMAGWWVGAFGAPAQPTPDSDFAAVAQGYLSVTPLSMERHDTAVQTLAETWLQTGRLTQRVLEQQP
jgi:5'-nucleotidase